MGASPSTGALFSNTNSVDKSIYVSTTATNGWVAILLPEGLSRAEDTITLLEASTLNCYYLFGVAAPTNEDTFVSSIRSFLESSRSTSFKNLTLAWLYDIDADPTEDNTLVMGLVMDTSGNIKVGQTFNYKPGNNFASLRITNNTVVTLEPEDAPTDFQFAYASTVNIVFEATNYGSGSLLNQDLSIPLSGAGPGTLRFLLGLDLAKDIDAYGIGIKFYSSKTGETAVQTYDYPLLEKTDTDTYAMCQVQLAPLDIQNQQYTGALSTYFALTGQTLDAKNNELATNLASYFALNTGYAVSLVPKADFDTGDAPKNNLYANADSGRFVLKAPDADATKRFELQIEGDFYLDVGSTAKQHLDENGQLDFMPGLSGTETISFTPYANKSGVISGSCIRFLSGQAAFAEDFPPPPVDMAKPGTPTPTLATNYSTSWGNIVDDTPQNVQYVSQPRGASLYARGNGVSPLINGKTNLLGFFEPSFDMPETVSVPMAPYLSLDTVVADANTLESQVLSNERKSIIVAALPSSRAHKSLAKRSMLAAAPTDYTPATTPQGLVTHVLNAGNWSLLNLGQNDVSSGATPEYVYPDSQTPTNPSQYQLGFVNLSRELQNAFMSNQQFLVMTQKNYLGDLFSDSGLTGGTTTTQSIFNNKMSIVDWPFDINIDTSNSYANYNNVILFKFCDGSLLDWVKNPGTWTQANTFNTVGAADDDAAYQQLVAISTWIQNYIADAEEAYQYGLQHPETNQAKLYENFHNIVNQPNWNGVLVLKADIDLQEFPQQLKGLISGIDLTRFNAHHFGIEINKVNATASAVEMEKNSSLFGLINYLDTAYQSQLLQGVNPEKPVPPVQGATYDFKVLQLQVLFENTSIKLFQSKVQLCMNKLFSDKVTNTNNPLGAQKLNSVVLDGTYQDHDGTPVYIFENNYDNLFYFDSNILKNVEITKIQFNTLTTDPNATEIKSNFSMWGFLNFEALETTTAATKTAPEKTVTLDAFSFGNPIDGNYQNGLNYSSLYIDMSFKLATPSVVAYGFDASKIAFSSNQSSARPTSLYPNFALQINNLVSGKKDALPSTLGYLQLNTPGVNLSGLSGDWYGLEMTLNMGTPGELASSLDFNSSLLIAWNPGGKASDTAYNAFIGIKLPGTSSNAKLLSLQGVLKLSIDTLKLEYIADDESYMMTLSNIALKFLGILKLPPGGSTNFLLFGNPKKGATAKSLGWYAAYNKTQ
jgi:hypothetical protein